MSKENGKSILGIYDYRTAGCVFVVAAECEVIAEVKGKPGDEIEPGKRVPPNKLLLSVRGEPKQVDKLFEAAKRLEVSTRTT